MVRGILFVLSGPSGVGKGTILDKLMNDFNGIKYSISVTTRKPRKDEKDGIDYFFVSTEKFQEMKREDLFLETACVHGNYYGTPQKYVEHCLSKGEDVILEIDIQGARQIKNKFKDTVYIFLLPPNNKELKNRLKRRLKNADQEISEVNNYDYSIVNDQIEKTVQEIKEVIKKERSLRKE